MKLKLAHLLIQIAVLSAAAGAQAKWDHVLVDPDQGQTLTLPQVLQSITPGTVVVLGEEHGNKGCHEHQQNFLNQLAALNPRQAISVGMEHFDYPNQDAVDAFLEGLMPEAKLLQAVGWGKLSFDFYRPQVVFPKLHGGKTYALNLPRPIAHRISQVGVSGLTPDELAYLPPRFQLGNRRYFERFVESMGGAHSGVPIAQMQKYFEAQSAWDDTMAARTVDALKANKNQVIVILVGNFHAEYFGGLPDRLRARGIKKMFVIPQLVASNYNQSELLARLRPDFYHGPLGDAIWVVGEPRPKFQPQVKPPIGIPR